MNGGGLIWLCFYLSMYYFFFLGQAAVKIARSFTGTAAGVAVREDRDVWQHESQPSRAPQRVEQIRGAGSRRKLKESKCQHAVILFWLLCCCIHRENHWRGQNREMPWRRDWPTVKRRTLWVIITWSCAELFVISHQTSEDLVFLLLVQRLLAKLTHKEKEASKLAEHLDFEKVVLLLHWFTKVKCLHNLFPVIAWFKKKKKKAGISHTAMYTFLRFRCFTSRNSPLTLCFPPSRQDNTRTTEELSKILQSTRDHLESELNRTETEKAHLAAQIQVCEHAIQ